MPIDSHPYQQENIECCPHLTHLREHAASGSKNILELAQYLNTENDTLPDELKPLGQALTDMTMRILTGSYAECLMRISELGLQEITSAQQGNQKQECCSGWPSQQEEAN